MEMNEKCSCLINQAKGLLVLGAIGSLLNHLILNLQRMVDHLWWGFVGYIEKVSVRELKCDFFTITMMWVLLKVSFLYFGLCQISTQLLK